MRIPRKHFETLVWEVVDALPAAISERVSNLEFAVRYAPTPADLEDADPEEGDLFGLYVGIPLTERSGDYMLTAPDLITIFQRAHEDACDSLPALRAEVKRTVLHELAHHFGIDDDRLEALDRY